MDTAYFSFSWERKSIEFRAEGGGAVGGWRESAFVFFRCCRFFFFLPIESHPLLGIYNSFALHLDTHTPTGNRNRSLPLLFFPTAPPPPRTTFPFYAVFFLLPVGIITHTVAI